MLGAKELEEQLQLMPRRSVAMINTPPESALRLLSARGLAPDQAEMVTGFAARPVDLARLKSVYSAARDGHRARVSYARPGQPGSDLRPDWLIQTLRHYGAEVANHDVSINKTWSTLRLPPAKDHRPSDTVTASSNDSDPTSHEGTGDITSRFPADLLGEPDASATAAAQTEAGEVEGLPSGAALLIVQRGPNAGSRFLLDQPLTSAGRHPGSDIFLDDVPVSRRHAEFRRENGEFLIVDVGSLNGTYVNRQPVESAVVLANGDEIQLGKFRLMFLTRATTGRHRAS